MMLDFRRRLRNALPLDDLFFLCPQERESDLEIDFDSLFVDAEDARAQIGWVVSLTLTDLRAFNRHP